MSDRGSLNHSLGESKRPIPALLLWGVARLLWPATYVSGILVGMVLIWSGLSYASDEHSLTALLDLEKDVSTFASALKHSGLWEELHGSTSITVLAPSNAAMQREGSIFLLEKVLLTDANAGRMRDLMSLHLAIGVFSGPGVKSDLDQLETLSGTCFEVARIGNLLRIGPSFVLKLLSTENGNLFIIDRLLWRPWKGEKVGCGSTAVLIRE